MTDVTPTQPASILVVDDDLDTCRNLADILCDFGYRVDTAREATAAIAHVRKSAYDVVLLDFKMPGMDGLSLYREIKKIQPAIVAIMITAFASRGTEEAAMGAGTWKVLAKPVDFSRLMPLVAEALRQPLVLLVDDDCDLCSSLWDVLREGGYRVGVAHSLTEAEERLHSKGYRVVLADLKLPEGNGTEVVRAVRQINPEARTILITGHRGELQQVIEHALAEGADSIHYKPLDIAELLATVKALSAASEA